jgi:hypothetical protein
VRRAPPVVRRLLPHRLALAAAVLTVTLAAALLAALASFAATVGSYAVHSSLAGNPGTAISITASASSPAAAARADSQVRASLRGALPGIALTVFSSLRSDYLVIPAALGGPNAETHVISLDDLPGHAILVAGTWPGLPGGSAPVAVAVPSSLAGQLHLAPGALIKLRGSASGAAVAVRVSGIFRPLRPDSSYWSMDPPTAGPQRIGGFTVYGSLVAAPAALAGGQVPVTSAAWTLEPDISVIGTGDLQSLAGRLRSGLDSLGGSAALPSAQLATGLPGLLSGLGTALVVARSQLAIGATMMLVLAGATLGLAAALLGRQRETEAALLRSRGASRWQMAGTGLFEGVLLVVPAAVAGPLLGGSLLPSLARRGPLGGSALRLPVAFPAVAWLAAAAAAAGCAVIIALPWVRGGYSPVAQRVQRGRQGALASTARAGADLALIGLAVLAGWQLAHYSAPVSAGLDGALGIDPILVSAPVLALTAGAVVLLRLLPLAVRLGDHAAARGRDLPVAVAAWQISRRPLRQAGPVLLAVLAVATTVIAVAQWSSWQRSVADRAAFATGADVRVDLPPAAPLPLGQVAGLTRAPGVQASTPVIRSLLGLPDGSTGTLLALDSSVAASVAAIRPDLAGGSPGATFDRLAPRGAPLGAPVPGRPARLLITTRAGPAPVTQPVLFVQLTDSFGVSYLVQAGIIAADGRPHSLVAAIAPGNRAAYPLRITGFTMQYQMPLRPGPDTALTIESVRAAAAVTGPFGPPFSLAALAARLIPQATAGSSGISSGGGVIAQPAVTGAAVRRGTSITISFAPGAGNLALLFFGALPGQIPADVSATAGYPAHPLPAAATSAYLRSAGQAVGSTFPVTVAGTTLTVTVVSKVSAFPTITDADGGLIVDQRALQAALAAAGAQPEPVTEWWLRAGSSPVLAGLPPGTVRTERSAVARSLLTDPLAAAPQQAMLAIAAAAVILACAGFLVSAATARERATDLALLAAIGATHRQLTRLLCVEQAMLAIPAAVGGLVLGGLLARLVVPAVTITSAGSRPEPPVLLDLPWAVPVTLAALIAALPVLIVAFGAGRRSGPAARARLEART